MNATTAYTVREALTAANTALLQLPTSRSVTNVHAEKPMMRYAARTYSAGAAVRFATFGVRANAIFDLAAACWRDLSVPPMFTVRRTRLNA